MKVVFSKQPHRVTEFSNNWRKCHVANKRRQESEIWTFAESLQGPPLFVSFRIYLNNKKGY